MKTRQPTNYEAASDSENVAAVAAAVMVVTSPTSGCASGDRQNGSIISNMTDSEVFSAASALPDAEGTNGLDAEATGLPPQAPDAFLQVILPDGEPEKPSLVVTMPSVEIFAINDHVSHMKNSDLVSSSDAPSETDGIAASPGAVGGEEDVTEDIDRLDEYIRSPEVQHAIVERSPGGRYVRFMEKLGSGASKDVFRAYDTQEGIEVAWNVVNLSGVPKSERNRIVNEVRLLERLHHQNIISFHGSWVNRERQEVNFVTEILSSGTLKSFINKVQLIRWKIAKRWATQILKGLEYLHSQDPPVIHRDLKAENIFINGTSGDLRIGDLGLSTVHRNGRVLSVLGTPEFMAPDMYEDGSYDVKVDIYAFGMVMLEIFTKEIPYSECMNPAQIYKKVSAGEPPEVLKRLQSRHAREFVKLCLGYKDDSGKYIRPSATELLQHAFLEIREGLDDEEVVVRPPLRENVISESNESTTSSHVTTPSKTRPSATDVTWIKNLSGGDHAPKFGASTPPTRSQDFRASSLESEDEDTDHFGEMPESEINMKKVKVLMGRGHELDDGSLDVKSELSTSNVEGTTSMNASRVTEESSLSKPYLVAAAVVGPMEPNIRPYPDDYLKLVVTLPVDGQTQNVQFDFHLIEDDPVQVAKEMVQELDIPQDAVLEISQTISGLARTARMQVEAFNVKINGGLAAVNAQLTRHTQSIAAFQSQEKPHSSQLDGTLPVQQCDISANYATPHIADYSGQAIPSASAPQGIIHVPGHMYQSDGSFPQQQPLHVPPQQATPSVALQVQQIQTYTTSQAHLGHPTSLLQQPVIGQGLHLSTQASPPMPLQQAVTQQRSTHMHMPSHQVQYHQQQQQAQQGQVQQGPVANIQSSMQNQQQVSSALVSQQHVMPPHISPHVPTHQSQEHHCPLPSESQVQNQHQSTQFIRQAPPTAAYSHVQSQPPGAVLQYSTQAAAAAAADSESRRRIVSQEPTSAPVTDETVRIPGFTTAPVAPCLSQTESEASSNIPGLMEKNLKKDETDLPISQTDSLNAGQSLTEPFRNVSSDRVRDLMSAHGVSTGPPAVNGLNAQESLDDLHELDVDSEASDAEMEEELKKLEEDFKKNLQRTRKVFDSRMESLQRTLHERECQHQKTLEKHQKEKLEFEKRLAQEEEQQARRLDQLQREWEKKRKELTENRRHVHENTSNAPTDASRQPSIQIPPSLESSPHRSREGTAASSIILVEQKTLQPPAPDADT